MSMKSYAIVRFLEEEDAPGIVATSWISEDRRYRKYPNVRTNETRDRLIKSLSDPTDEWSTCSIKILREYESFSEARLYLRKAEETSNLDSEPEEGETRRKRKRRPVILSEEENSEEDEGNRSQKKRVSQILHYPTPISQKQEETSHIYSRSMLTKGPRSSVASSSLELPLTSSFSSERHYYMPTEQPRSVETSSSASSTLGNGSSCSGCSPSQKSNNGQVLEMLTDMAAAIKRLEAKINSIAAGIVHPAHEDDEDVVLLGSLPVKTEQQFLEFETKLREGGRFRQKLFKVFASIGGKSARSLAHNMMKRLMLDELAESYSLSGKTGKNVGKKAFASTEAFKIITGACKKIYAQEPEGNIREAVSDWLNQARVRIVRREQQQQRKHLPQTGGNTENNM